VKLKELAQLVSGKITGNGELDIQGVAPLEEAKGGDLAFVLDQKHIPSALKSGASAFIVPPKTKIKGKVVITVDDPRHAMVQILPRFGKKSAVKPNVHETAVIAKSARIGKRVTIYPFVYIGENCEIGDDSVLYPSVTLYDEVKVGKRVVLHSGARIGVDGFGYVQEKGKHIKIPQVGNVIIEDDVEIYSNVCISRATIGSTIISAGTKVDNLSHIAHNCRIGKNCAVVSLVGFAGSVTLKDNVYVAGQAGFNGHITVGENTVVMARAGITKDIPANSLVSGFPAQDHSKEMELQAALRRLAKKAR
jgi:UDP-3-O-[3-hydroxymyristoyl] glucosamine N-acyltransferase